MDLRSRSETISIANSYDLAISTLFYTAAQ